MTEIDIRIKDDDNSPETLTKQAKQYASIYEACLSNDKCVMVNRWNFDDDHSWVASDNPGYGRATLFGSGCKPKIEILSEIISVLERY